MHFREALQMSTQNICFGIAIKIIAIGLVDKVSYVAKVSFKSVAAETKRYMGQHMRKGHLWYRGPESFRPACT